MNVRIAEFKATNTQALLLFPAALKYVRWEKDCPTKVAIKIIQGHFNLHWTELRSKVNANSTAACTAYQSLSRNGSLHEFLTRYSSTSQSLATTAAASSSGGLTSGETAMDAVDLMPEGATTAKRKATDDHFIEHTVVETIAAATAGALSHAPGGPMAMLEGALEGVGTTLLNAEILSASESDDSPEPRAKSPRT